VLDADGDGVLNNQEMRGFAVRMALMALTMNGTQSLQCSPVARLQLASVSNSSPNSSMMSQMLVATAPMMNWSP